MKRTPFKTNPAKILEWNQRSRKSMRRTPMRKIGPVGKANQRANRKLREVLTATTCEIGALGWPEFQDCLGPMFLQNVHRHPRSWYKGDSDLLADINQVVRGCTDCHARLDRRTDESKELTERVFTRLRD